MITIQKYIKKLNYILRKVKETGFFYIFGSSTISKVIAFLSSIILVRVLTKNEYGIFSYSYNIITIFLLVNGMGTMSAMLQFGSEIENEQKKDQIVRYGFRIGAVFNTFIILSIIIFSLFGTFKLEGAKQILLMMAFLPLFDYILQTIQTHLRIEIDNKKFGILNTTYIVGLFVFQNILALFIHINGVVFAKYISYILTISLGYYFIKDYKITKKIKISLDKKLRIQFLKYSLTACVTNAVSQLLYTMDIFFIGVFISSSNIIASYKVATIIPFALMFIPTSCMTYLYPHFVKHNKEKKWIFEKLVTLYTILGGFNLLVSLFLYFGAPIILKIFFGAQYESAILPFRILAIGYFISGTFRIPAGNILLMLKQLRYNLFSTVLSGILNIILDILLIKHYGSVGAALATLSVYLFSSICDMAYLVYTIKKIK